MVSRKTLVSYFVNIGCVFRDEKVIQKCLELCETYEMDEEILVELWVAYSVPHFIDFEPTVDSLTQMEKSELKDKKKKPFQVYNPHASGKPHICEITAEDMDDLLGDYGLDQPTISMGKRPRSPGLEVEQKSAKVRVIESASSSNDYPAGKPTPRKGISRFEPRSPSARDEMLAMEIQVNKSDKLHIPRDALYMFETLSKQGRLLTLSYQAFGEKLCQIWHENGTRPALYVRNVKCFGQKGYRTFGRISIIQSKKSDAKTILLEGTKIMKGARRPPIVTLDLKGVKRYSIFSGQMVGVEGTMQNENVLAVSELFSQGYASMPKAPALKTNLRLYVAAGPFTTYHSSDYQPLWNLLECVKSELPHVLILIGPIVEAKHSDFQKHCSYTYQEVFHDVVTRILKELEGCPTRVIFVSSHRDSHHDPIYPTMEYMMPENDTVKNNLTFSTFPDPCIANVDDLLVGITAVDSIKDLSHSEITNMTLKDRLGRLADHVLSQSAFYPVYPPPTGSINIDTSNWRKYGSFETQPHILILPSDIRQFSKVINRCLVVNPGRLFKGVFAKLEVPGVREETTWSTHKIECEIEKYL